jgi:hypothetical protein
VLLQPDTIEQTMPWLKERYGDRLQGIGFDQVAGVRPPESLPVVVDPTVNDEQARRSPDG